MAQDLTAILEKVQPELGSTVGRDVSFPVTASDIRKWAIAVYWPETPPRLFWDEEHAKKSPFGGLVAPEDFNPFVWQVQRGGPYGWIGSRFPGLRVLNGGFEMEYHGRIGVGDVITSEDIFASIALQKSARLGQMLVLVVESRWKNQRSELVRIVRRTHLRY